MAPNPQVLAGDETGLVKVVSLDAEGRGKTSQIVGKQSRELGVKRMIAYEVHDVAIATNSGSIQRWTEHGISEIVKTVGGGKIEGLGFSGNRIVTCGEQGVVEVRSWPSGELSGSFKTSGKIDTGKVSSDGALVAVGGKNNDLKVWDLRTSEVIFKARNVPQDSLSLEIPVWITDLAWSGEKSLFTCTAYNQIRAYDFRQRRPTHDVSLNIRGDDRNKHLNCITLDAKNNVIVGDNFGKISLVDVPNNGRLVSTFKGPKASIRSISVDLEGGFLACGGLDRYVRLFDLASQKPLGQCYMKQKITSVILGALPRPVDYADAESDSDLNWGEEADFSDAAEEDVEEDDEAEAEAKTVSQDAKRVKSKRT